MSAASTDADCTLFAIQPVYKPEATVNEPRLKSINLTIYGFALCRVVNLPLISKIMEFQVYEKLNGIEENEQARQTTPPQVYEKQQTSSWPNTGKRIA